MHTLLLFVTKYKKYLYFIGMAIMAISLPVSEFLMSISMFVLAIAWLLNGPKAEQWQALKQNKLAWITLSIFLIEIVGLLNTTNYEYAISDLRVKLPLLLVPIFISPAKLSPKKVDIILSLFVGSTLVGSIICYVNYQLYLKGNLCNIRDVSIYISHIRFSLMINLSIFILIYFAVKLRNKYSIVLITMALWLVYFLFFLGSGNGYLVFSALLLVGFFILVFKSPYPKLGLLFGMLFLTLLIYLSTLSFSAYHSYFIPRKVAYNETDNIKKINSNGNLLSSNIKSEQLQNGYYVWRNISSKELSTEWNKRADKQYLSEDIKHQNAKSTLIRYLTSMGATKDSAGMAMLSDKDIRNIEMGYPDYQQSEWNNLELRVNQFFFQLSTLKYHQNQGGKPFVQRLQSIKGALNLIKHNFFTGVGTGDIQDEFNNYYQKNNAKLGNNYRIRTHNQYLTYFVTLGIFGFIWFLFATIYPLVIFTKTSLILSIAQFILLLSFLSEDTLETQPGVTFYIFIIALGIITINQNKSLGLKL